MCYVAASQLMGSNTYIYLSECIWFYSFWFCSVTTGSITPVTQGHWLRQEVSPSLFHPGGHLRTLTTALLPQQQLPFSFIPDLLGCQLFMWAQLHCTPQQEQCSGLLKICLYSQRIPLFQWESSSSFVAAHDVSFRRKQGDCFENAKVGRVIESEDCSLSILPVKLKHVSMLRADLTWCIKTWQPL